MSFIFLHESRKAMTRTNDESNSKRPRSAQNENIIGSIEFTSANPSKSDPNRNSKKDTLVFEKVKGPCMRNLPEKTGMGKAGFSRNAKQTRLSSTTGKQKLRKRLPRSENYTQ
jgi:hypothetical protein